MLKLYIEQFSSVYEPAEGGYYVEVSDVSECGEFADMQQALEHARSQSAPDANVDFDCRYYVYDGGVDSDGYATTELADAAFVLECDRKYIGDGYRFICADASQPAPAPKSYVGYR